MKNRPLLGAAAGLLLLLVVWSGIAPTDRLTWASEIVWVLGVIPLLFATYRRFPLTSLLYGLVFLHAVIIAVGAHYTHAQVPLGFAIADLLSMERNPYDRIGHLAQGIVPTIAAREILIRGRYIRTPRMLVFLVLAIGLAITAAYELLEWAGALLAGKEPDGALGAQGDPWDTQADMFCALIGGVVALLALSRWHDRQIANLITPTSQGSPS
jgi:putative membrane protein